MIIKHTLPVYVAHCDPKKLTINNNVRKVTGHSIIKFRPTQKTITG